MTFEIRFKAQHKCPFLDFSKLFGQNSVYSYCSREFDVLLITGEITQDNITKGKQLFPKQLTDFWRIVTTGDKSQTCYIIMDCICDSLYEESITSKIQHAGGMLNYPIIYKNGWEYHKIICVDKKIVASVMAQIETLPIYEILSIDDLGSDGLFKYQYISIPELINDLTYRQIAIFTKAFEKGYYDIPRNIRTQDLADEFQITRYGVEKNLRKAENKLIKAIIPYLYFKLEMFKTQEK